jgi:hypothetical protein
VPGDNRAPFNDTERLVIDLADAMTDSVFDGTMPFSFD